MERKKSIFFIVMITSFVIIVLPAYADTITHFGDGPFTDVSTLLMLLGIPNVAASETIAEEFMVPGISGTVDLTFTFERDTGDFLFSFGFCDESTVFGLDPIIDKQTWATACLAAATEVFDDSFVNPFATSMHNVPAGTELIFYLIPDNDLAVFNTSPGDFFPSGTGGFQGPLFSVSNANPGEFDQMLSFIGGGVTLFTFEDLTRSGESDEDFTDIAFSIDVELMPMMPPDEIIGGEIIPINTTALLLAGVQSVSMWMIPVVVSGIGIGVFVIMKIKKSNL